MSDERYKGFLGVWVLIPESCSYEQGHAPQAGLYEIAERDGELHFTISWCDAEGEQHKVAFSGIPDGEPRPFAGGPLADAMSVNAVSETELTSHAFYEGRELMIAQRQLDATGEAMRVVQLVRLPDGSEPVNTAVYRRQALN